MKVIDYIRSKLRLEKLHMTLIDPEKLSPKECANIAYLAFLAGTDAVMVGGSTGIDADNLDSSVQAMKDKVPIPIIQFPSHSKALSSNFDAIYFMSLLNSKDIKYIIGEQMMASPIIKDIGIETIPMGYVIVEPGMKVGEMGDADPVKRNDLKTAIGYALAAEFLGMKFVYLEAGSGAPEPVPPEMIEAVKNELSIPLIVGGGIRDAKAASRISEAGADIVVTGTIVELSKDVEGALRNIVKGVKSTTIINRF
ncbi:MAG: geranylgeranylglyceryl/heptaprenylglyceryl phosphate synthase [Thermoplasmata archaeon]|nr:MAG: geranylgeranylglyceryl/heptaprenylglyceryl phosphate synthase [Thermoplasmata archaeon]